MKVKQINGKYYEIDFKRYSDFVKHHFDKPENYTDAILGEWESEPFKDYISKEDNVILDIGANIGLFALHVMPYVEQIICVEPTPSHMAVQRELLSPFTQVTHEQSAANSFTGECGFWIEPVNYTMNTLSNQYHSAAIQVPCITLYDLCQKYELKHVHLCKVDIEGSETQALTVETLKPVHSIIDKFLVELHPRTREMQDRFKAIFEEAGYKAEYFDFNGSLFCYK